MKASRRRKRAPHASSHLFKHGLLLLRLSRSKNQMQTKNASKFPRFCAARRTNRVTFLRARAAAKRPFFAVCQYITCRQAQMRPYVTGMFQTVTKLELHIMPPLRTSCLPVDVCPDTSRMHRVQTTIKSPISFSGPGLHSGAPATVTVRPASAHHGIWFSREDVVVGDRLIPAHWDSVNRSPLCTCLLYTSPSPRDRQKSRMPSSA